MSLYLLHLFLVFLFAILFLMGGSRLFPVVLLGDLSWPSQTKSLHSNLCILNFHVAVSHSVYVYSSVDQFIGRNVHIWIRRVHPSLFLNVCLSLSLSHSFLIHLYHLPTQEKHIHMCYLPLFMYETISSIHLYASVLYSSIHFSIHPSIHPFVYMHIYLSTDLPAYITSSTFVTYLFFQTQLSVTKSKVFTCFHSVCSGVCTTQYLIGSDHITPYNEFMAYSCYRTTLHYSVYIYIICRVYHVVSHHIKIKANDSIFDNISMRARSRKID